MTHFIISPRAERDIEEIVAYIADDNPDAADRFRERLVSDLRLLVENPGAGAEYPTRNPRLAGLRRWRVSGFRNYLIFYTLIESELRVLRVLHGARDIRLILELE